MARISPRTDQQFKACELLDRGLALLEAKKPFQARPLMYQAAHLWPDSPQIAYNLGYTEHECGQYTKAITCFQHALRLDPHLGNAMMNIGYCYQAMGDPAQAKFWLEKFLSTKPPRAEAESIAGMIRALDKVQKRQKVPIDPNTTDYLACVCEDGNCTRWPIESLPLKVFIANGKDEKGNKVKGFSPRFNQLLLESLDEWVKASQFRLAYTMVSDVQEASIVCTWTDNPSFLKEQGNKVEQGVARVFSKPSENGTHQIKGVHLTILVNSRDTGKPIPDDDMKKACLHELGHALGLAGHSNNNRDVMFFSESPSVWPALTKRDKATLSRLYSDYPVRETPPTTLRSPGDTF